MKANATALAVLAALLVPPATGLAPAGAQEPPESRALSEAEFVGLVNAKTPVADIVAQIRARGIAFEVSADMETNLPKIEGGPELLRVLREPATLEVSVEVAGAEVIVDGELRGRSVAGAPLAVPGLRPGTHLVRVQAERFVSDRKEVFLKPGETRRVELALQPSVESRPGLLGMEVDVRAGTKEDALVAQLESVRDPDARVEQLQAMIRDHADSPLALLGYRMLQVAHLEQNHFDEALAAGEEILRLDPSNFRAQVRQAGAQLGKGDVAAAFDSMVAARQLLRQAKERAAQAAAGTGAGPSQVAQTLEDAQGALDALSYNLFAGSAQLADPKQKAAALERFLELYPNGNYAQAARINLAYAYQQTGEGARSLEAANRALEANPREASMMVLVADTLSEKGEQLARARQLATELLEVVGDPGAVPSGMDAEQWDGLRQLWQGMAHSILGQVLMHEETARAPAGMSTTREAVKEFQAAGPLLKAQTPLYARNLFRLAFAYAKLGELVPARDTLNELIALQSVYTPHAQDLLEKVGQAMQRRKQ